MLYMGAGYVVNLERYVKYNFGLVGNNKDNNGKKQNCTSHNRIVCAPFGRLTTETLCVINIEISENIEYKY